MSHKSLVVGSFLVLVLFLMFILFLVAASMLQGINPIAALTAFTVAVIGIVWFKKTTT